MTVKQHVKQFKSDYEEAGRLEAFKQLVSTFFGDMYDIIQKRNIGPHSDTDTFCSLLDEYDKKWQKVAEELYEVDKKGFRRFIFDKTPELRGIWEPKDIV